MIDPLIHERNRMRRLLLAERDRMSPEERHAASERITDILISLPILLEEQNFFIYCQYRSEVATIPLLHRCLERGKTVCVPLSKPEQAHMLAVVINDPLHDLAPGYKGIPEPLPSLLQDRILPPASIGVAVIPGAVFDPSGHRLGYGGGFYDRFLAQAAPQAIRIGLAFFCQMVDRIPVLPHDVPMDMVITEQGIQTWSRK